MFSQTFYHGAIRRAVIAFGTMFNNISVVRSNDAGTERQRLKVPLQYMPKKRFYRIINDRNTTDRQDFTSQSGTQVSFPRMSFAVTNIDYDTTRKTNTNQRIYQEINNTVTQVFPRIPYKLSFELGIYTKKQEDGFQILEQILPYFSPSLSVSYRSLDDFSVTDDMIVNLVDVSPDFETETSPTDNLDFYAWTLSFNANLYVYGPSSTSGVIHTATTTFYDGTIGKGMSRVVVEIDPITASGSSFGCSIGITELAYTDFGLNTSGLL